MNLYIVRHAHALPVGDPGIESDPDRPLSKQGHEQVVALVAALQRAGIRFDKLLTSPLARARRTAEGIGPPLGVPQDQIVLTEILEPGASGKKLGKLLRRLEGEHVALVGHEPDLSRLTAWLIGSKRARIDLAKAGVACVACDGPPCKGAGTLSWLITPTWFPADRGGASEVDHALAVKPTGKSGKN
jgi:phosphohistidine phosphatase